MACKMEKTLYFIESKYTIISCGFLGVPTTIIKGCIRDFSLRRILFFKYDEGIL